MKTIIGINAFLTLLNIAVYAAYKQPFVLFVSGLSLGIMVSFLGISLSEKDE
jgi:hypothetical protein